MRGIPAVFAIALAALAPPPIHATLVMFQWTPERILLAADSLAAKVHASGQIDRVSECKIHQQGNFFFAIVGINDDPAADVDLVALAARAAGSSRNLRNAVHNFEVTSGDAVRRLWDDVVKHRTAAARLATESDGRMSLSIVFVSRKEHAIAIKEYSGTADGAVVENPTRFYGSESGMRQDRGYVAVGVYADAQAASLSEQKLGEGVPFVNAFYQVQIARELKRVRQQGAPRIGAPVCILQVTAGNAGWVAGQQGPCAAIQP